MRVCKWALYWGILLVTLGADKPTTTPAPVVNSIGIKFIRIEPGTFLRGSPLNEAGHIKGEARHKVTLTRPFMMAATHVTVAHFRKFVTDTSFQTDAEREGWAYAGSGFDVDKVNGASWRKPGFDQGDDHQVVDVSWNDAAAFCDWLSKKERRHYRLPTEAEWEYAARGGTSTAYPWGDNPDDGKGWANCADLAAKEKFKAWTVFNWSDGFVYTSPVGHFRPNRLGLYDMIGNASEWCSDWWDRYPDGDATDPIPTGPANGADRFGMRVLRGGSWDNAPESCRCAHRDSYGPGLRDNSLGFRICFDVQ